MAFGWDGGPLLNYWIACMGQGDIGVSHMTMYHHQAVGKSKCPCSI